MNYLSQICICFAVLFFCKQSNVEAGMGAQTLTGVPFTLGTESITAVTPMDAAAWTFAGSTKTFAPYVVTGSAWTASGAGVTTAIDIPLTTSTSCIQIATGDYGFTATKSFTLKVTLTLNAATNNIRVAFVCDDLSNCYFVYKYDAMGIAEPAGAGVCTVPTATGANYDFSTGTTTVAAALRCTVLNNAVTNSNCGTNAGYFAFKATANAVTTSTAKATTTTTGGNGSATTTGGSGSATTTKVGSVGSVLTASYALLFLFSIISLIFN